MGKGFAAGSSGTGGATRSRRIMGVMVHPCHANYHIPGVCSHPGSKPDLKQRTERRRAKNKTARHSRRINR